MIKQALVRFEPFSTDAKIGKSQVERGFLSVASVTYANKFQRQRTIHLSLIKPLIWPDVSASDLYGSRVRAMNEVDHAAAFRTSSPSAVTCPPDARMIERMVSTVMFCWPLRMRQIDTPLSVGVHRCPNSSFVGEPGELRY